MIQFQIPSAGDENVDLVLKNPLIGLQTNLVAKACANGTSVASLQDLATNCPSKSSCIILGFLLTRDIC